MSQGIIKGGYNATGIARNGVVESKKPLTVWGERRRTTSTLLLVFSGQRACGYGCLELGQRPGWA